MTTGLSDKQLQDAHDAANVVTRHWVNASLVTPAGLRAVADLAITHQEAVNWSQAREIERLRIEPTIAQKK